MDENIYAPPQSELIGTKNITYAENVIASRWKRLWASLIDSLIIMPVTLPVMYFTGGFDGISQGISPSISYQLLMAALFMVIFFAINGKFLITSGQTIGKKALRIKIVDLNGDLPTFKKHLVKRYAAYFLPGQIPVAGQLLSIINILFIFGKQKRCIHDYFAATKVVEVSQEAPLK